MNVPKTDTASTFDFSYSGDVLGALPALKKFAPGLTVLDPEGTAAAVRVEMNLRGTTAQRALREISEQAGDIADVVWTSTAANPTGGQVLIRFRSNEPREGQE